MLPGTRGIHTVSNSKIISSHFYSDQLEFLEQLGMNPTAVAH